MIEKMKKAGLSDITPFYAEDILHPDVPVQGDLYLANVYGRQHLITVREREMDNSDGAAWLYPYQTKRYIYYLIDLEWFYYSDLT